MRAVQVPVSQLLLSNQVSEVVVISYADLIARGFADAVHKVLVAQVFPENAEQPELRAEIQRLRATGSVYVVIEGNHRAVGYALLRRSLPGLELECDADLEVCRQLAEEGGGGRFVHDDDLLQPLVNRALEMSYAHLVYSPRVAAEHARELVRTNIINLLELPRFLREQVIA